MNNECCHQHPENGDLALQTEAQREETDLRDVNAQLLAALEKLSKAVVAAVAADPYILLGQEIDDAQYQALAAITEAKK